MKTSQQQCQHRIEACALQLCICSTVHIAHAQRSLCIGTAPARRRGRAWRGCACTGTARARRSGRSSAAVAHGSWPAHVIRPQTVASKCTMPTYMCSHATVQSGLVSSAEHRECMPGIASFLGKERCGTWSTLFMKQVLPRLDRPRKPYGKLCDFPMALSLPSLLCEAP